MSSVLPSSFSWGFDPKIEDNTNDQFSKTNNQQRSIDNFTSERINQEALASLQSGASLKSKRKHTEDDQDSNTSTPRKVIHKKSDKFRVAKKEISHKRSRVPRIVGQPLPTDRIIEVLDKKNLQHLLTNLVNLHPEITQDLYHCAPKPTVSGAVDILANKVDNILNDLPYKVDASSEYAFLRVKPLIDDFLSALSDYTLHFLPPVETQPSNSLEFLDSATNLLHKLPNFAKLSNNYFKELAYEQLSHTWCICLKEFIKGPNSANNAALLLLINNNWEAKLKKHNEDSNNKLESVVEYFREEVSWLNDEFREHPKVSNNFSPHNSPLHSFKTKNLLNEFR
ncbi:hypothetical protein BN7_3087 [Wickerhamomyces ciferrii]|uniref:Tethering factor for nuclear proteasome STS1 n=1 Tax=Wickerhamomyces ciferrii (strain ATCC 14091 / BCRC 22168 / CBS 111 / JCM 3599 / NBRC 0793 / NRRL Y-1031 F-60-10) TaxID=1206466 RepID=K0KEH2_WICCF|nr:uncharacterized protein BN7_3087 [Wickerhamomyces ciferrii]CCH43535.1 hypothetical protein BN7_3087 [Wickerhamomyces ciferrii]